MELKPGRVPSSVADRTAPVCTAQAAVAAVAAAAPDANNYLGTGWWGRRCWWLVVPMGRHFVVVGWCVAGRCYKWDPEVERQLLLWERGPADSSLRHREPDSESAAGG